MSFSIVQGYLLSKKNFNIFDEIVTFITTDGNIFSCVALGTKKILSKNAKNLIFCRLLEFEFFSSRQPNKLSKLMRVKNHSSEIFSLDNQLPFLFINEVILISKLNGKKVFDLYLYCLDMITKIDKLSIVILFLIKSIFLLGIKLILNHCSMCKSKKIINFSEKHYGFLCKKCNDEFYLVDSDIIKIIYLSYVDRVDKLNSFDKKNKIITIKILLNLYYSKLGINLYNLLIMF